MDYREYIEKAGRALNIKRTLGVRRAAAYMRNQGFDLEVTLALLLGCPVRPSIKG